MRRFPSSWHLIKAKLGVICAGPTIKSRHHAAPDRPLRGIEVLEDRRVLSAVGYFVRQDLIANGDVYSEANALAHARQQAGWLPYQAETDGDNVNSGATNEVVAHAGAGFATSLVDHADGGSVGNALAQVPTDILDTVVVPTVSLVTAQLTNAGASVPTGSAGDASGTAITTAVVDAEFTYVDTNGSTGQQFYGGIYLVGVGVGNSSGDVSGWTNVTTIAFTIAINDVPIANIVGTGGGAGQQVNGVVTNDTLWSVEGTAEGYEDAISVVASGLNLYINVVADIEQGDRVRFSGQLASNQNAGVNTTLNSTTVNASANFAQAINAYGFAFPEGEAPPVAIGPGVGGSENSPGDINGDGVIDQLDSIEWIEMLNNWAENQSPYLVVTTEDDVDNADYSFGDLSLREAIALAGDSISYPGADRIVFAPWVSEIDLNGTELIIDSDIQIVGPGAAELIIDGNGSSRVFTINAGAQATISGLTITGGNVVGDGGGLLNAGDLTLHSVVVAGNTATSLGGGVQSSGVVSLHVINSTIDGNRAVNGSGLYVNVAGGVLEITGSTISNNRGLGIETLTYSAGGGLSIAGTNASTVSIANSTFSGNSALYSGGIRLQNNNAATTITNTTIAYNTGNESGGLQRLNNTVAPVLHNTIIAENKNHAAGRIDVAGALDVSSSYNIFGAGSGSVALTGAGNQVGTPTVWVDPLLAPLGDYGGKTKTHALKNSSPALDAGKGSLTDLYDQRGYQREYDLPGVTNGGDGYRDIGAYEAGEGTTLVVRSDGDRNDSVDLKATVDSLRIREAIALSAVLAGSEVISFDQSGWSDGEIDLSATWGQLSITSDVVITKPEGDLVTIDGQNNSRVMNIGSGTNVTLKGLRITGGYAPSTTSGGGILNNGDLTLESCHLDSNTAALLGGGIYVESGSLTAKNSTVSGNNAFVGGGGSASVDLRRRRSSTPQSRPTRLRKVEDFLAGRLYELSIPPSLLTVLPEMVVEYAAVICGLITPSWQVTLRPMALTCMGYSAPVARTI